MRLTKEEFCEQIELFKNYSDLESKLYNEFGIDIIESKFGDFSNSYYNLLQNLCDFGEDDITKEYGTDLDYFVYELDFGRKYKDGMVKENGVNIRLQTPEDLYDLIINKQTEK